MSRIKHPTSAETILIAIKNNMVAITNVDLHYKEEGRTESISTESFVSDLEFYCESGIFAYSIDFRYSKHGKENLLLQIGNMSPYCNYSIDVDLHINDGVTMDSVKNLLNEIFLEKSA